VATATKGIPMALPEEQPSDQTAKQVNDLFDSLELTTAVETEEFRLFLEHIPIAIVISKHISGDQRIVFANKTYEELMGQRLAEIKGRGWSILQSFKREEEPHLALSDVVPEGEDFLGCFLREQPKTTIVEAYSGLIENEDGTENYRVVALIDVTEREKAQREEFARQLKDKDLILKEVQHRVKNNLQLVAALIRLEARNERRGDKINLVALAGRIESLQLLYQALEPDSWGDEIELGHYLNQIASAVMNTYGVGGIRLNLKIDHTPASINVAMPVGLLVNELLTNAFKHAFSGRATGVITLECLRTKDSRYCVLVADDGVGIPDGKTWPVPGKIGALILQTLRENTKTELNLETAVGKGTRVTICFVPQAPKRKAN
jgi:PAS domain S-box-containing protein